LHKRHLAFLEVVNLHAADLWHDLGRQTQIFHHGWKNYDSKITNFFTVSCIYFILFFTKYPFFLFNSTQFLFLFCITHTCTRSFSHTKNIDSRFLQKSTGLHGVIMSHMIMIWIMTAVETSYLRYSFLIQVSTQANCNYLLLFPLPTHTTQTIREISDDLWYFVCPWA
jgi:hypothetical protein